MFLRNLRFVAVTLVMLCSAATARAEPWLAGLWDRGETQLAVFGGQHYSNSWQILFTNPGKLDFRDGYLLGGSYAKQWDLWQPRLSFGLEMQLVKQMGEQTNWEVNMPVFVRYEPVKTTFFRSFSFGLGLSYASTVPQLEVNNKGKSNRTLAYWDIEFEWGPNTSDWNVFTRLHHRSAAFGAFPSKGGSNALVAGIRWRL